MKQGRRERPAAQPLKSRSMLPDVNPIDAGCVPRGWPIDHLGSRDIWCPNCEGRGLDSMQPGEAFRVICGSGFGFGTPYFVRPFLKRSRTAGKVGQRGSMEQCRTCGNVYPDEDDGTARWWADKTGMVSRASAATSPDGPERPILMPHR